MKLDLSQIQPLIDSRHIDVQVHPTGQLLIYNYTQKCQFDRVWNEQTMMCRGLITTLDGEIVARPFKKFFNYGEYELPPVMLEEPFEVFEKYDGSLGILYFIGKESYIATRGSFASEQAFKATEILKNHHSDLRFDPKYTYLFEIIYPQNKIVVDYGRLEALVLLTAIETETGKEKTYEELWEEFGDKIMIARRYNGISDVSTLKGLAADNQEGFVVRFASGLRLKVKFEEYVRLHRLITGFSSKSIWECLKNDQNITDFLENVPDEFYQWVSSTKDRLESDFNAIKTVSEGDLMAVVDLESRKEKAIYVRQKAKYPSIVFTMMDGKDYKLAIWKLLRPKFEKPFRKDIDA